MIRLWYQLKSYHQDWTGLTREQRWGRRIICFFLAARNLARERHSSGGDWESLAVLFWAAIKTVFLWYYRLKADHKGQPPPTPPGGQLFLIFFGVRLTLGYDYTCSETDFIKTIIIIQLVDQNSQFLLFAALSQSRNFETPHKRWNVFWVSKNQISMPIRRRITHSYSVGIFLVSDFHQILAVVKMAGWSNNSYSFFSDFKWDERTGWSDWFYFAHYHQ